MSSRRTKGLPAGNYFTEFKAVARGTRKVSQTQLAQELGISQALVSLVLNGRKQGINAETYERIWEHALKRGYHPKGMHLASSPTANRANQVGFILRAPMRLHSLSHYFAHVQHGLHTALEGHGLTTSFLGSEDLLDREKLARVFGPGHSLRGVVLLGEVARPFLDELRRCERRIVAVSAKYSGLCHSVLGNEPQALDSLVQHLHGLGHRRIGWLGGNAGLGRHEMRLSSFKAAMEMSGLTLDRRYVVLLQEADRAEGGEAMHALLIDHPRRDFPTAFVAYNCLMAAGAIKTLQREGCQVPGDISVVGADAPRLQSGDALTVTGAGTDPVKLGEAAARLMLASTGGDDESFSDLMLPSQLVIGESSGPISGRAGHPTAARRPPHEIRKMS